MGETRSEISVAAIYKNGAAGRLLRLLAPAIDRALGIRAFRERFERDGLRGLDRFSLIRTFVERERLEYSFDEAELRRIPARGPVVVVANHPMGGLEGVLLMAMLERVRPDFKVFANIVDSFIEELKDSFIFTNPMAKGSATNYEALRLSREWLAQGHCLLVFPAGRVGLYRPEKGYVTDESWDPSALALGIMTKADFVPIYVEGESSALFSFLSEYIFPMKLLFLIWEFLGSLRRRVAFHVGRPIPAARLAAMRRQRAKAWLRMRAFLLCPPEGVPRRRRRVGAGMLHPEVEDYIGRYGLDDAELRELAEEAGSEPRVVEALLSRLSL